MKILFSPSEGKNTLPYVDSVKNTESEHLKTKSVLAYVDFLKTASEAEILKIFGSKKLDLKELSLSQNLFSSQKIEAIRLYSGVGYKALDFASLDAKQKEYIYNNLYIFSNLFGALRADVKIPYYNLHQGKGIGEFKLEHIYKTNAKIIDAILADDDVLDLRASAYIKAYEVKTPHIKIEFLKNGKKLSHFAKHYRGIFARQMALQNIKNLAQIESIEIENLKLVKKFAQKNAMILVYDICEC